MFSSRRVVSLVGPPDAARQPGSPDATGRARDAHRCHARFSVLLAAIALSVAGVVTMAPAASAQVTFSGPTSFAAGSTPTSTVIGDFDELPKNKAECRADGWKAFHDGTARFRNRGDCVSFVAGAGRNPPGR